jgi:hypothetical protein
VKYIASHWAAVFSLANQNTRNDPIWLCLTLRGVEAPQFQPAASPPTAAPGVTPIKPTSGYKLLRPSCERRELLIVFTQHHSHLTAFL